MLSSRKQPPPAARELRSLSGGECDPLIMPFGKYKGRIIADLPGHYLNWLAREGFARGEFVRLIALTHEMDHNGLRCLLEQLRKRG